MRLYYILKDKQVVGVNSVEDWAIFNRDNSARIVKQDEMPDGVKVSTVFLGVAHGFDYQCRPVLFETMVFGGEHSDYQERYCTWEEAEEGHKKAVKLIFEVS